MAYQPGGPGGGGQAARLSSTDTIVAVATPPGRGAVGVVRVSGPAVPRVAEGILGRLPPPRAATLANFRDVDGSCIDQGLALYFPAPHSFTGEPVLELQGHGGPVVLDLLLARLVALGCRLARPGEFSERAFLNGKLDIAQAEAVADLIGAATAAAARAAVRSLSGEFSARIDALLAELTGLRVRVEAAIDFPEEDLDLPSWGRIAERLAATRASLDAVRAAARQGALLRDGLAVVIAGPPNAGKSSLLNRLAGEDVAIVAPVPGTTRDVLRQPVNLDGLPLVVVDTAGLRVTADPVEAEGVRRAGQELRRADHVLYVLDATEANADAGAADLEALHAQPPLPADVPRTLVYNKIDLCGASPRIEASPDAATPTRIYLSARTGTGIDLLRAHLKTSAGYPGAEAGGLCSARRRHIEALETAGRHLDAAAELLGGSPVPELLAEELRLAQAALGEITGEFTSDDLLGRIFADFCIGK